MVKKEIYDKDYYENGIMSGKSNYEDYSWSRLGKYFQTSAKHIVGMLSPESAIDLGCAKGFLVKGLSELGVFSCGIDISEYAVQNAHPDIKENIKLGNISNLPYGESEFDVAICFDVLEHIAEKDVEKIIKEMLRVARKHIVIRVVTKKIEGDIDATHQTIRNKKWWEKKVISAGGIIEQTDKYVNKDVWWFNIPEFLIVAKKPE